VPVVVHATVESHVPTSSTDEQPTSTETSTPEGIERHAYHAYCCINSLCTVKLFGLSVITRIGSTTPLWVS